MDAHLFQLFVKALLPNLIGSRIEKFQEPVSNLMAMTLHGGGQKYFLYFQYGRKNSFCFTSKERFSVSAPPSDAIMRLRRYFGQKKITAAISDPIRRRLWLLAAGDHADKEGQKKSIWLCLDISTGPEIYFFDPGETPEAEPLHWPEPAELKSALSDWRSWPILTPALRRTFAMLDEPEQWALLQDLRYGSGDIFLYANKEDKIRAISAWPLPANLQKDYNEYVSPDILPAFSRAGIDLVLAKCAEQITNKQLAPVIKRAKQLRKILDKLKQDENRLNAMLAREPDGIALQASLFRWPADLHVDKVSVPFEEESRLISLDPRFTIRENMECIFHHTHRARRGLAMISSRRDKIRAELEALESQSFIPLRKDQKPLKSKQQLNTLNTILPKNIQAFLSSDGYVLLRGKDAKGNLALRRVASPHDYWCHVENGPGAHVIIRRPHPGHEVPEKTLHEAGSLAALKSWLKEAATASVEYAELRHIKPVRKGPPGTVIIDKILFTRIVDVKPNLEKKLLVS